MTQNKDLIPFNEWSRGRIEKNSKFMTSRHKEYKEDHRVWKILPKMRWGDIRDKYWMLEGARSPDELQNVIEDIYKRKVPDDEMFYVHFGDFR